MERTAVFWAGAVQDVDPIVFILDGCAELQDTGSTILDGISDLLKQIPSLDRATCEYDESQGMDVKHRFDFSI